MTIDTAPTTDSAPPETSWFTSAVDTTSRIVVGAVALAIIWNSYNAMVAFCIDRLDLAPVDSQIVAVTIEGALLSTALLALRNALRGRSYGKLMAGTWFLAALSGAFAAADQLYLGHGMVGAAFRFFVPVLGAALIHELLNIDKSQAVGLALLTDLRQRQRDLVEQLRTENKKRKANRKAEKLMLAHIRASEDRRDELARAKREGREPRDMEALDKAESDTQKAALAVMTITEFTRRYKTWVANNKEVAQLRDDLYTIIPAGIEEPADNASLTPVQTALATPAQPRHKQVDAAAPSPVTEPATTAARDRTNTARTSVREAARPADSAPAASARRQNSSSMAKAERDDKARLLKAAGLDPQEIAEELGCNVRTVQRALKRTADAPAHTPGSGVPVVPATPAAELVGAR